MWVVEIEKKKKYLCTRSKNIFFFLKKIFTTV